MKLHSCGGSVKPMTTFSSEGKQVFSIRKRNAVTIYSSDKTIVLNE
jgi:hypothetical protein